MKQKLIVDIFAGGGGVSIGIYMATGRHPDIAINHSDDALSMHRQNHPHTRHFIADVYEVCPKGATQGKPVGWLHLSPDCTHHSQAAGGQPRSKKLRGLAWVGYRWAGQVKPDVISLENVTQILKWGPLIAKRCKKSGRVITLDEVDCPNTGRKVNRIAEPGERVPVHRQYLVPNPKRCGQTWRRFTAALKALGYDLDSRTLCAADFGAPTTRKRLFMIARRDGLPVSFPEPTHFKKPAAGQNKWRTAAECIDFNLPCQSIFDRKKPLAEATMRRIAKGLTRYVIDSDNPFIVQIAHYGSDGGVHSSSEPLRTITSATKGGEFTVSMPIVVPATSTAYLTQLRNNCDGRDIDDPLMTVSAQGQHHAVVTTFISRQFGNSVGQPVDEPAPTIMTNGTGKTGLVSVFISSYYTDESNRSRGMDDQAATITTENRLGLVECTLSPEHEESAMRVAAFLMRFYSEGGQWGDIADPMATITTKDRLALVTVTINGHPHVIVDIGLRMLQPAELYKAHGFPDDYQIEHGHDGRKFTKTVQVRLCGNSVPTTMMAALVGANYPHDQAQKAAA